MENVTLHGGAAIHASMVAVGVCGFWLDDGCWLVAGKGWLGKGWLAKAGKRLAGG
jgi:hypothetical protein